MNHHSLDKFILYYVLSGAYGLAVVHTTEKKKPSRPRFPQPPNAHLHTKKRYQIQPQ